jgi:hypothetical protein
MTALNAAGKAKTPTEFFDALAKGTAETDRLEQELFNRQTEREKKRILQRIEAGKPKTSRIGELSGEEIEGGTKAEKTAEKTAARAEEREKKELDSYYKEIAELRARNAKEEQDAAFKNLSLTEQRNKLLKDQLAIEQALKRTTDEKGVLEAKMADRKKSGEIADINKKIIDQAEKERAAREPKVSPYAGMTLAEALKAQGPAETAPIGGEFPESVQEYQDRMAKSREGFGIDQAKSREDFFKEQGIRRELANPLISKDRRQQLKEQLKGLERGKEEEKLKQSVDYLKLIEEHTRGVGVNK